MGTGDGTVAWPGCAPWMALATKESLMPVLLRAWGWDPKLRASGLEGLREVGLHSRVTEHQGRSGPCRTRGSGVGIGHGPTKRAGQTKCRVSRGDSSLKSCPGLHSPQRRLVVWAVVSGGERVSLVPRPRASAPPLSLLLWTPPPGTASRSDAPTWSEALSPPALPMSPDFPALGPSRPHTPV